MAILTPPKTNRVFDVGEETPPRGTFIATCIDIRDMFGVERPKFNNPSELEKVDLTAFLFGFRAKDGTAHRIASRSFKISGNEKSGLYQFLKAWLGQAPKYGWDYCELKGAKALVTVDHQPSRTQPGAVYAIIATISPLPEGYQEPASAPTPPAAVATAAPAKPAPAETPPPPQAAPVEDADEELPF